MNKLNKYNEKRNFDKTPEPQGIVKKNSKKLLFVIQKHHATALHYDFRIEVGGVLKSWAVPKGPSVNPSDKRLAMPTEDHPISYSKFEGLIPNNNYGAGPVIIWDRGTYENIKPESTEECLKRGLIEIEMNGEKMKGKYALVRGRPQKRTPWFLVKMKDDYAHKEYKNSEKSIVSGKTIDQIN